MMPIATVTHEKVVQVVEETRTTLQKFTDLEKARAAAAKNNGMVIKEEGKEIYYVFPNMPYYFQVSSMEED